MQTKHLNCPLNELKLAPKDSGIMEFSGYGAVFNNVDWYGDVIEPGAFTNFIDDVKTGKQNWPVMMLQHGGWGMIAEDMMPIGIWTDLAEDNIGLKVTGRLADTDTGKDCYTLLKMEPRPAINALSIGYIAQEYDKPVKPSDPNRRLKRVDLPEISLVTFPANERALITDVKTADMQEREFEKFLRDSGIFSKKEAQIIISRGFRSLKTQRDSERKADLKTIDILKRNIEIMKP